MSQLLKNVHENIKSPSSEGVAYTIKGFYDYYHYGCDNFQDQGWGCGYRTLQTICSWIHGILLTERNVPTIPEIQQLLVQIGDKPKTFYKSKEWIGCVEASFLIDTLYDVPCKIVHVNSGRELGSHIQVLIDHFVNLGSPVMMGGDKDCSSKGIVGVYKHEDTYLLVVDPHFMGDAKSTSQLQSNGWIKWQKLSDFSDSSFYNFCFPQIKYVQK